jgi:hypothetical protein
MERKYVVAKAMSTTGAYIVERNTDAPRICNSNAHIAGYASTKREAQRIAREANNDGLVWDDDLGLYRNLKTGEIG